MTSLPPDTNSFLTDELKNILQKNKRHLESSINELTENLYETLLARENYSQADQQLIINLMVKKDRYRDLLDIDMHKRKYFDKNTITNIYKYLDEIKSGLTKHTINKGLSSLESPRYTLSKILDNWNNHGHQEYGNIDVEMYKYLPEKLQNDIYKYLKMQNDFPRLKKSEGRKAKYLQIVALLNRETNNITQS